MKTRDVFRPHSEPYRTIYDALIAEARHRKSRNPDEWLKAERLAMWNAARDYAQQHGLDVPTIKDVEMAENQGIGHIDYAAKVAYALGHKMLAAKRGQKGG